MPLPLKIALRFLFRTRQEKALYLFTGLSIIGIAFSVLLFFMIDTILSGFSGRLQKILVGFDAPLLYSTQQPLEKISTELWQIQKHKIDFNDFKFYISEEFYGLLKGADDSYLGMKARVVGQDFFDIKSDEIRIFWFEGFDIETFLASKNAVLLGEELYKNLNQDFYNQDLPVVHPFADLGPQGELEPQVKEFEMAGLFTTGYYDIDNLYIFIPRASLPGFANQNLLTKTAFLFPERLSDTELLQDYLLQKSDIFSGDGFLTWAKANRSLFRAMALEKIIFLFLFAIIVVISIVNITSVIWIFAFRKERGIAILMSLGMTFTQVKRIYFWIGFVMGLIGSFLGLGLGFLGLGLIKLSDFTLPEAYGFEELPLNVQAMTVFLLFSLTAFVAATICYLSSGRWQQPVKQGLK